MKRPCTCGHDVHEHEDAEGGTHECSHSGCDCKQFVDVDEHKIGAFYWVRIAYDPDTDEQWVNEKQPARYAGDGKWQLLDTEGTDWPVIWVGGEIVP